MRQLLQYFWTLFQYIQLSCSTQLILCTHARLQLPCSHINRKACSALAEKGSSRRLRGDSDSTDGDTLSSVSASTLASLRDDFGDEDPADEHPLERVIDALYEKRHAAAVGPAVQKRAYAALGCLGRVAARGAAWRLCARELHPW